MSTDEELLKKLDDSTKHAIQHQLETLHSILHRQISVRYLQRYLSGLNAPIEVVTFKRRVPLSTYGDYIEFIDQMADGLTGDQPPLSVDPLVCFFYSSGTSSMKPKLIPYHDSPLSKAASFIAHQGSASVLRRLFPPREEVNKKLMFMYAGNLSITKAGFKAMPASTYPLHTNPNANWSQTLSLTSPIEVIFGSNVEHQTYCHLLCALRKCDVIDGIIAAYAVGLTSAFSLLESKWVQLCDDIASGITSPEVEDVSMRNSVNGVLGGPKPDLSTRIRLICENKNWRGIVCKLWPNVRYIKCVTTGSMMQFYSKLKQYAGDVPMLGGDYFASECPVGINLDIMQPPEKTRYVILPTAAYFEFLPFDLTENKVIGEDTMDFYSVEVGKLYEIVVTTYRGLYRYRLGDIVRVVGFYNASPTVEFVMRAPVTSETLTEKDLMSAMENFQLVLRETMDAEVIDFTSFMDLETNPKRLKLFIEVREGHMCSQQLILVLSRCCVCIEEKMGAIYKVQRDRGEIDALLVSFVKPGSFDRLLNLAVEKGVPAIQYKSPKIMRNFELVDFMKDLVFLTIDLNSSADV